MSTSSHDSDISFFNSTFHGLLIVFIYLLRRELGRDVIRHHPKTFKNIDYVTLHKKINDVIDVDPFVQTKECFISFIKNYPFDKKYTATVSSTGTIDVTKMDEILKKLKNTQIIQKTPIRVLHRRADIYRPKRIYTCNIVSCNDKQIILDFLVDSGLYVKEFVHGDVGRTKPSLAELYGKPLTMEKLDVTDVDTYNIIKLVMQI